MSDIGQKTDRTPNVPAFKRVIAPLFATLLVFWVLLNGSVSISVLFMGGLVAGAISIFFSSSLSVLSGVNLTPSGIGNALLFLGYFLKELVKANVAMARLVVDPDLPIDPAIVKVRTRLTHPVGRLLLANAITLTPGTLTCEIKGDHLYIHWVLARDTDIENATREIVSGFERYLEKIYG